MNHTARVLLLALCLFLCFSTACKKGSEVKATEQPVDKYAAIKETVTQYVTLLGACAREVETAAEAGAIAAALNKMNDGMLTVAPKIKSLATQFPELNDPARIPADLKPFMEKMDTIHPVMMAAMQKANSFASDPLVQQALGRFGEIQKLME